ncbi:DUF3253 domain-containing protein [Allohahella marinimesophila]|uniref:DUF3253 domain-containing protein n=1 Tax=Allohahella marinimesophila TaxID=1054972 RepID=A0ABP7NXG8_9GAMM
MTPDTRFQRIEDMTENSSSTKEGYVLIKGRHWRCTDPKIPENLRQQLVNELMAARRAVAAGKKAGDEEGIAAARARVQAAKVALGERGPKWWLEMDEAAYLERAEAVMVALLNGRDDESSICPSDVARVIGGENWRDLMPLVRELAFELAAEEQMVVMQKGKSVGPAARGPVRIARRPSAKN